MREGTTISRTSVASIVGITSLATFLSNVSSTMTYVPAPEIVRDFGIAQPAAILMIIAYLVPFAVVTPVTAKIGDVYGQKQVFLFGLGLYAVTSLAAAFTLNFNAFLALRAVQGLGGGIILVSMVFIVRQVSQERQGLSLGIWRAALLGGTVGGPPLGGYIAAVLGWPAAFWITGAVAAVVLVWAAVSLQELPFDRTRRFDWVGATAFTVGFSSLVIGLSAAGLLQTMAGAMGGEPMEGTMQGTLIGAILALAPIFFGVFLASLVVLAINQKVRREPLLDASLLRNRQFLLGNAGTFLVCVGMFSAMMFLSLELRNIFDFSGVNASNILALMAVAAVIFGVWGGQLTARFGAALPWAGGFVLTAVSFIALANLLPPSPAFWLFAVGAVLGAGQGLPLAPTTVVALEDVPAEAAAEATGLFDFSHNMGRAISIGAFGALFVPNDPASYVTIFWVSAVAMGVGAALTLGLPRVKSWP